MPSLTHTTIPLPDVGDDDLRLGHLIAVANEDVLFGEAEAPDDSIDTVAAVIVGFPSDSGVALNGGRTGAAGGPIAIRDGLYRLTPDARQRRKFAHLLERTVDAGDLELGERLEADQEALGEIIAPIIKRGAVPIILGGGHETAFGHFLGHVYAGREISVLNWDAHPDVRPMIDRRPHSGSPFRQMLSHLSGSCAGYVAAGLLPHHTSSAHVDWLVEHGGEVIWRDDVMPSRVVELYRRLDKPTMVSFDLDAVDQAYAPGVSAPSAGGLDQGVWLQAAYEAGRCLMVTSMDVVELNPRFDPEGRTARLAALTVWSFLRGLSERIAA